jgi:hypothetical protein
METGKYAAVDLRPGQYFIHCVKVLALSRDACVNIYMCILVCMCVRTCVYVYVSIMVSFA